MMEHTRGIHIQEGKSTKASTYPHFHPEPGAAGGQRKSFFESGEQGECGVFMNPAFKDIGGKDIDPSAFAKWTPDEEISRSLNATGIKQLLDKISEDDQCYDVIGFQEFPYTRGNKLVGNEREIERELWVKFDGVDKKLAGNDELGIFHVHFAGKWHPVPDLRDRSVITQINARHTTKIKNQAFHKKCQDLNKLREKYGKEVSGIPKEGWKWKERPDVVPAMHAVLNKAEKCTRQVRSFSIDVSIPGGSSSGRALIWANTKYEGEKVPELPNAVSDGIRLCDMLRSFDWEVEFIADADKEKALKSLSEFVHSLEDTEDDSLFGFVGHGVELKWKNYLVPRDARLGERQYRTEADFEDDVNSYCIPFSRVSSRLAVIRNDKETPPHSLFMLDCCRNSFDSIQGTTRSIPGPQSAPAQIQNDVKNSITIYSTTSGNTAADGKAGQGGPFMCAFTEAAKKPGLLLESILKETRAAVQNSCGQMAPNTSLLTSDFYFSPPVSTPSTPFSPSSPGSRYSWSSASANDIVNPEAQAFWKESFTGESVVDIRTFAAALKQEFTFIQEAAGAADLIMREMDVDKSGSITLMEFNIFTRKVGLESACRQVVERGKEKEEKQEQEDVLDANGMEEECAFDEKDYKFQLDSTGLDTYHSRGFFGRDTSSCKKCLRKKQDHFMHGSEYYCKTESELKCQLCGKQRSLHTDADQFCPLDKEAASAFLRKLALLRQQGHVSEIVQAMKMHAVHRRVQEAASQALLSLTPSADGEEWNKIWEEKGAAFEVMMKTYDDLAERGVIEVLVQAMTTHLASEVVVASACKVLWLLSRSKLNKEIMADKGGIKALISSLVSHKGNAKIMLSGFHAIGNIAANDNGTKALAIIDK